MDHTSHVSAQSDHSLLGKDKGFPQCKKIRRFYSKIPGNQLPVHIPLFLMAFLVEHF